MTAIDEQTWDRLVDAATEASQRAYAPYSKFRVGAALLGVDGEIYTGCNVENATFGATVCAERHAIGTAVGTGARDFRALVVLTHVDHPVAPCGICRQVIAEFCDDDFPILIANVEGDREVLTLGELLPHRFTEDDF